MGGQPRAHARRDRRQPSARPRGGGEGRARGAIHLTVNEIAEHLKLKRFGTGSNPEFRVRSIIWTSGLCGLVAAGAVLARGIWRSRVRIIRALLRRR